MRKTYDNTVLGRHAVMNTTKWIPYTDEEADYLSNPSKPVKK